jgi:DNA polymerase-2
MPLLAHTGWLLDLYPDPQGQVTLWLLSDEEQRLRFTLPLKAAFYAAGPPGQLRQLWQFLQSQEDAPHLRREERRDLFEPQPVTVLAVESDQPARLPALFYRAQQAFPDLNYYDADISFSLRCAAAYGLFPLGRVRLEADEYQHIHNIVPLDTPWELDPERPPLRQLSLQPDCDPAHAEPAFLQVRFGRYNYRFPLNPPRPLLANLNALLRRHDPDLLLTTWGDTWLLPGLLEMAERCLTPLPLNRDERMTAATRPEHSYFSYGQIVFRGQQVHLFGRWHVDCDNALLFDDLDLEGILEFARVTSLPVQESARVSPGTGISSMQLVTALRQGILVPWHKQQNESFRPALDLFARDQGGLVYQPIPGLHANVGGIDFVSMYPSLMVRFNISPETAGSLPGNPGELERFNADEPPGLIPQTLAPLLEKRIALKTRLSQTPRWDPRRARDQTRSAAHKWLLVTCFGYLGYKNARFGRIESHEAVTAYGREALLRAKEIAEDLGGTVLHLYVDGLWIKHPDWQTPADFQALLQIIAARTGLSISLDGVYRWVVFLASRVDARVPVANRYFGVFQDGSLKVRGIEARRHDTPPWIKETQMTMLELLAEAPAASDLPQYLPAALGCLRRALADLADGRIEIEKLLISQKLSRALDVYRVPSPPAVAARQLKAAGKTLQPGQRVRFLYTHGHPGVQAWDLPRHPDPRQVNRPRYRELMLRAAQTILEPMGVQALSVDGEPIHTPSYWPPSQEQKLLGANSS